MRTVLAATVALGGCGGDRTTPIPPPPPVGPPAVEPAPPAPGSQIRIATFNACLNRPAPGVLYDDIVNGHPDVTAAVAILRRVRPDIVLVNELDQDPVRDVTNALTRALAAEKGSERPLRVDHRFAPTTNTGRPSGFDLDRDGEVGGPGDAWGYGAFEGQFAWAILSRFPIDRERTRCFGTLRWSTLPQATLPDDPQTPIMGDWYAPETLQGFPLSSKNHCDVVVDVDGHPLHVLASHPTPPVFDGPEDRNGLRNRDEIRLWSLLLTPTEAGALVDDAGRRGGPPPDEPFVLVGDFNADPVDGNATGSPVREFLLSHPRVVDPRPTSAGAERAATSQAGANLRHRGPAQTDTADFPDDDPGNLRVDYVLPSRELEVIDAGVFWPVPEAPESAWIAHCDHRLVWVDIVLTPRSVR